MGSTGLNWAVFGCSGLYWAVLGCTGLYWAALGCTGIYWSTGLDWALIGWGGQVVQMVQVVRMISIDDVFRKYMVFMVQSINLSRKVEMSRP